MRVICPRLINVYKSSQGKNTKPISPKSKPPTQPLVSPLSHPGGLRKELKLVDRVVCYLVYISSCTFTIQVGPFKAVFYWPVIEFQSGDLALRLHNKKSYYLSNVCYVQTLFKCFTCIFDFLLKLDAFVISMIFP